MQINPLKFGLLGGQSTQGATHLGQQDRHHGEHGVVALAAVLLSKGPLLAC